MELFELMEAEQTKAPNFPDKSLIDGLVIERTEHLGHDPDENRRIWVDGGFLHGYLQIFKMQYDEVILLAKSLERENKKQKRMNADLLKEVKRLNTTLESLHHTNEQLSFGFERLRERVELNIKKQHAVLEMGSPANKALHGDPTRAQ